MILDVSPKVFELQRHTVPHFKEKVIIYNSFYSQGALRQKLGLLHTKKSVQIICIHPLVLYFDTFDYLQYQKINIST